MVIALGLGSRRWPDRLPGFVAEYAGDALWALAAFVGIGMLWPGLSTRGAAAGALAAAFGVEFGQRYHAEWIDAVRATMFGKLLLGSGFLASDLVCYAVGVAFGAACEVFAPPIFREHDGARAP